ncbi:SRPBCC family protein [Cellulomonas sp. DKR-3]|uniref:SRPBCC family protein n=1 Tax=Cellulomonas fulva TaxID=2835530 RepID=A0ABS5TY02_9CELL|nr:SRPBCC family protein [Cellulomonas fulva]MBT0993981.1 SRPBCC family protein [Cellulomonas fulva]
MRSVHLSTVIHRSAAEVYAYAADLDNLPRWAGGLTESAVVRDGDDLVTESPMGRIRLSFAPPNDLGVLDHDVTLPSGETTHNPVRVLQHPEGAEIVFTLRQLGMTDDELARDAALVQADLDRLKELVEATAR